MNPYLKEGWDQEPSCISTATQAIDNYPFFLQDIPKEDWKTIESITSTILIIAILCHTLLIDQ